MRFPNFNIIHNLTTQTAAKKKEAEEQKQLQTLVVAKNLAQYEFEVIIGGILEKSKEGKFYYDTTIEHDTDEEKQTFIHLKDLLNEAVKNEPRYTIVYDPQSNYCGRWFYNISIRWNLKTHTSESLLEPVVVENT